MNPTRKYPKQHSFIEASAGTGKTYTIMEIIAELRLIDRIDLRKVLILTFTEKAAGELKERLRKKLQEINDQEAFAIIDEVSISTIHGFCQSILSEYPIETDFVENAKFIDNHTRADEALYKLEHSQWKNQDENLLSEKLILSDYGNQRSNQVLPSIEKLLSGRKYSIPELDSDINNFTAFSDTNLTPSNFKKVKTLINHFWKELNLHKIKDHLKKRKSGGVLVPVGYTEKLMGKWNYLKESVEDKKLNVSKVFSALEESIDFTMNKTPYSKQGWESIQFFENYFDPNGLDSEIQNSIIERSRIVLEELKSLLDEFLENNKPEKFLQATVISAKLIADESGLEEDWINFDAMISRVKKSLDDNQILRDSLRKRYDVGIIDEFQDTDFNQYQIFKTIFLDGDDPNKALYLIGDPKQSIYGFRGADIGTYLTAEEELKTKNANAPVLKTNYRSVPELVEGYNLIFKELEDIQDKSYFPIQETGSNINYEVVGTPDTPKYILSKKFPNPPIQAIHLIKQEKWSTSTVNNEWNRFILEEIQQLLNPNNTFECIVNEENKKIAPNDIAILVNSKVVGRQLENLLSKNNIPCSFYKQPGIYQSQEANQLQVVLECIEDSHNPASYKKLLLSDLFSIDPKFLPYFDEHSIESYEKKLLDHWRNLAEKRNFAELFRSLEEDSKISLNLDTNNLAWERKITNYKQIFKKLLQFSLHNKSSLREVIEELKTLRQEKKSEEEQPLFEKETEKPTVQILTIHASKGLEWPIVFIHSLAGKHPRRHDFFDYPIQLNNQDRVWKISLWEKNTRSKDVYDDNENKRKYYVALTRPQVRLYLPYTTGGLEKNPYTTIISNKLSILRENKYTEMERFIEFREWESEVQKTSSKSKSKNSILNQIPIPPNTNGYDNENLPLYFKDRELKLGIRIESYSSLKSIDLYNPESGFHQENHESIRNQNRLSIPPQGIDTIEDGSKDDAGKNENQDPLNTPPEIPEPDLPSSVKTGSYLHQILENLDFEVYKNTPLTEYKKDKNLLEEIHKGLEFYGLKKYARRTEEPTQSLNKMIHSSLGILYNCLQANIPIQKNNFDSTPAQTANQSYVKLVDIPKPSRIPEMDFHWRPDLALEPLSLVKGSIDLVFLHDNKYYLVDYKSNNLHQYDSETMRAEVEDNPETQYHLQRDIYALVFYEYLCKLTGDPNQAIQKFGGVFYFFLRGMKANESLGIYSDLDNWNSERFQSIKDQVNGLLLQPGERQ